MTEVKLRSRIKALEEDLASKGETLQKYESLGSAADDKIQALTKIHNDKIRSLMGSIQMLKKDNAQLINQGKEHKRSQLIANLNKQIDDQDIVIEVIRNYVYKKEGKEQGRAHLDGLIIGALTKGPERIRAPTREELKIEIERLKGKLEHTKGGGGLKQMEVELAGKQMDNSSDISNATIENDREELFKTLQYLKTDNEKLKVEVKSGNKAVETLTQQLKDNGKLEIEVSSLNNEIVVGNRKVETLQALLRQTKEYNNSKIIELYQREIKVEELELESKQNSNKMKLAQQAHGMAVDQLKLDMEKLNVELESLGKENERLIMDNMGLKKTQDQQRGKIEEIRDINLKQKSELGDKLQKYEKEFQRLVVDNDNKNERIINLTELLKAEKASGLKERVEMSREIQELREKGAINEEVEALMERNTELREEVERLRELGGEGGGVGSTMLMERIKTLERRIAILENQLRVGGQLTEKEILALHDQNLMNKYIQLAREFQNYKLALRNFRPRKPLERVELDQTQRNKFQNMSSSISNLDLRSVNTNQLNNFDSDFEFEIVDKKRPPKHGLPVVSEYDQELMKLINSDIWDFIQDDKIGRMLERMSGFDNSDYGVEGEGDVESEYHQDELWHKNFEQLEHLGSKMKKGQKVKVYAEEFHRIADLDSDVSDVKTLRQRDLEKMYDSDIDIEPLRINLAQITDKTQPPLGLNSNDLARIDNMSSDISNSIENLSVSQPSSGESNINVYKKRQASRDRKPKDKTSLLIDRLDQLGNSDYEGQSALKKKIGLESEMNSSVSSYPNVNESALKMVSSDLSFGSLQRKK